MVHLVVIPDPADPLAPVIMAYADRTVALKVVRDYQEDQGAGAVAYVLTVHVL